MVEKSKSHVPAHMHSLSPHLVCAGAAEAIDFYTRAFGAEVTSRLDAPDGKVMNACLTIAGSSVMLVDEMPNHGVLGPKTLKGSPVTLHLFVPDVDKAYAVAVSAGARPMMWPADMFWGDRYGVLVDPFGHRWSLATHQNVLTQAELAAAAQAAMAQMSVDGPGCNAAPQEGEADTFRISEVFDVPRSMLWAALTEEAQMKQWWGPKGVKLSHAKLDLRPGGRFHYCMQTSNGDEMWGMFIYREIAAPKSLLLESSFSDAEGGITRHPLAPTWPRRMLSLFELTEEGGKTRFSVTWRPIDASPEELTTFHAGQAGMRQGWSGTMEQLAAYLLGVKARGARA